MRVAFVDETYEADDAICRAETVVEVYYANNNCTSIFTADELDIEVFNSLHLVSSDQDDIYAICPFEDGQKIICDLLENGFVSLFQYHVFMNPTEDDIHDIEKYSRQLLGGYCF